MLLPKPGSLLQHRVDAILRSYTDSVVLTQAPKSDGTRLGQILSMRCKFHLSRVWISPERHCVVHKHSLSGSVTGRWLILILRDGRDILISAYYNSYFCNDLGPRCLIKFLKIHAAGQSSNMRDGLPRLNEQCFRVIIDRYATSMKTREFASRDMRSGTFLRKEIAAGWRAFLLREVYEVFYRYRYRYRDNALISLGYEPNSTWVTQCHAQ